MRILSIGKTLQYKKIDIVSITESFLMKIQEIESFAYIIISGGDGTIRRVLTALQSCKTLPPFILNPTGSFNVVAKIHRVPKIEKILEKLAKGKLPPTQTQKLSKLNDEIFLFSAGNMGDLQHIFLSETLRFGLLRHGMVKYILGVLFLLPVHLVMTPFMLLSPQRFFIFTPLHFIKKFGTFYGEVREMTIELKNGYNLIELDGDIVTIKETLLHIKPAVKRIEIVC